MAVATFDTLKFARNLRDKAGLSTEQAEGFADAISEAMQGDLATKGDLREVETGLKNDMALLKAELRMDIAASKTEVMRWMLIVAVGFQTIIIIVAAMSALTRVLTK